MIYGKVLDKDFEHCLVLLRTIILLRPVYDWHKDQIHYILKRGKKKYLVMALL